jgi:hypothetical protein
MIGKYGFKGLFILEHWRDGILLYKSPFPNTVVNEGLQSNMDVNFSGSTPITTWYLGLTDGTPTVAAGDTLASHAGWTEVTAYSGTRKEWVEVRSGQVMTNSASVAVFSMTGSTTVGGAFLASVTSGTSGILWSAGALTGGDRSGIVSGDTLNLTYQLTASDV